MRQVSPSPGRQTNQEINLVVRSAKEEIREEVGRKGWEFLL